MFFFEKKTRRCTELLVSEIGRFFSFLYSDACNLSEQQQLIFDLVSKGHNVYFGGVAGCGKTFVSCQILVVLTKEKIEIACTCTTGIACTLYERCSARTIHSFAGLGQCRGSKQMLLRNVLANNECVRR